MNGPMSALTASLAEVIRPLREPEQRRAVDVALAALALRRPVVHGAELRIEKRRGGVPDRHTSVLVADLDGYSVHEVVVADGEVVETLDHPRLVPPFTPEEIAEATVLARTHPELAAYAATWGVAAAPFYPAQEHAGTPDRRRLVGVHFLDINNQADVRLVASAVVDLTGRTVESVRHHQHYEKYGDERGNGHGHVR